MQINKVSLTQVPDVKPNYANNVSYKAANNANDMFEQYKAQKLPENKAIQIVRRPGLVNLLNILTIPFGVFGFSSHSAYKLVDIDPNNLTERQQSLIRKGKMINFVPRGYHIENNKVVKNK